MNIKIETKALADAMLLSANPKKNGDGGSFGALLKHAETKRATAAEELEKYVKMTPAERMTQAMLKKLGLTKEQFDALPADQQATISAKIAEMVKQEMQKATAQQQGAASPISL